MQPWAALSKSRKLARWWVQTYIIQTLLDGTCAHIVFVFALRCGAHLPPLFNWNVSHLTAIAASMVLTWS